ncbi:lipid IV(A) 3-deoxy-D-manno-octulosonic acid transferase [Paraferrimonas haliotis]|uniref:3-deoxy-D-manno-octulosonic acid transferase n=1 Tax=Paraferrimonas haliotis TaxID=2013866 RepID=A0AA37TUS3_9GAMM|nr:lipid IV(A) 3-deoxy-D-manno-octulosonic acid transferase [Paraferrimonas haliotis]GLS82166.1 3-deoxy-D-manno-octulosonic acid transferase [Paraferrimonas haliotis]
MTRTLYGILLTLLSPLLVIYLWLRGNKDRRYRQRWSERFGLARWQPAHVLIHCVSMGETLAAQRLIETIQQRHPNLKLCITCSSPTGSKLIQTRFSNVQHSYLPFDLPWAVARFTQQLAPQLTIIMETELWPNLVHQLKRRQCKLVLANARLSEKSSGQYQKWPKLTHPMLASLDAIAAQTKAESERFVDLGVAPKRCHVFGSLKFDISIDADTQKAAHALTEQLKRPVWVAGSVHPDEFDAILAAHQQLLDTVPQALLIMVPRHPERFEQAKQLVAAGPMYWQAWSQSQQVDDDTQVVIGDTMGQLLRFYGVAHCAFVGGSLMERGGQNPLEPAAFAKPIIMGPSQYNFLEIGLQLRQAGALVQVNDAHSLAAQLQLWLTDADAASNAGQAALSVVARNQGAVDKHYRLLSHYLADINA